jgi:ArsR family transcriptional regulator
MKNGHEEKVKGVMARLEKDYQLALMAEFFQSFSDQTRLKIINALMISELCVRDLAEIAGMSLPAVCHHMRHLRQLRLVQHRREGKNVVYSLNDEHIGMLFDICRTHLAEKEVKEQ